MSVRRYYNTYTRAPHWNRLEVTTENRITLLCIGVAITSGGTRNTPPSAVCVFSRGKKRFFFCYFSLTPASQPSSRPRVVVFSPKGRKGVRASGGDSPRKRRPGTTIAHGKKKLAKFSGRLTRDESVFDGGGGGGGDDHAAEEKRIGETQRNITNRNIARTRWYSHYYCCQDEEQDYLQKKTKKKRRQTKIKWEKDYFFFFLMTLRAIWKIPLKCVWNLRFSY